MSKKDSRRDLRGFYDNESGLTYLALEDLEIFFKEDFCLLLGEDEEGPASKVALEFISLAKNHFKDNPMDA